LLGFSQGLPSGRSLTAAAAAADDDDDIAVAVAAVGMLEEN